VGLEWPGLLDLDVNQILDAEEGVIYDLNRTGRWTEVGDMLSFMPYLNFSSSQDVADGILAGMDPDTAAGYLPDDTHPDVIAGYKAQVDSIRTMHVNRTTAGNELIVRRRFLPDSGPSSLFLSKTMLTSLVVWRW
jgi:hypothetical protein